MLLPLLLASLPPPQINHLPIAGDVAAPCPAYGPLEPGWRAVAYPHCGELRYFLPVPKESDYPGVARSGLMEGTAVITFVIDLDGHIANCSVLRTSGYVPLDQASCTLYYNRARFQLIAIKAPIVLHAPVLWRIID